MEVERGHRILNHRVGRGQQDSGCCALTTSAREPLHGKTPGPRSSADEILARRARGAIGFDAVKHLVLCRIERRPPRLDLTVYPYLPRAKVATTSAKAYLGLLAGAAP